jgi:hypothetical protein
MIKGQNRVGTLGGVLAPDSITNIFVDPQAGTDYEFAVLGLSDPSKYWVLSNSDLSQWVGLRRKRPTPTLSTDRLSRVSTRQLLCRRKSGVEPLLRSASGWLLSCPSPVFLRLRRARLFRKVRGRWVYRQEKMSNVGKGL